MTAQTADTSAPITLRADSRGLQLALVWSLLVVASAAFAMGVPGLIHVGTDAGLGVLAWAAPIVLDGGQVVAALAWAVRRSQGRGAHFEAAILVALCAVSVYAQLVHVGAVAGGWSASTLAPALIAAAAPITTLAASHAAIRAVLAEPAKRGAKAPAVSRQSTPRASQPAAPLPTVVHSATGPAAPRSPTPAPDGPATKLNPDSPAYADAVRLLAEGTISAREASRRTGHHRDRMSREAAQLAEVGVSEAV